MIRIGVSPIAWANDDMPELCAPISLEQLLGEAAAIGFEGIELGNLFPRDAGLLAPLLREQGLALIGGWYGGDLLRRDAAAEIAAMAPHLDLLEACGASVVVFAETGSAVHGDRRSRLDAPPRLAGDDWRVLGARLDAVAAAVADRGLHFAYHHHLGTVIETAEDLQRLLDATGAGVGLTLDTGHAAYGGIDPLEVVTRYRGRIAHVHCKDVRSARYAEIRARGGSFLDGVVAGMFAAPGTGDLDFAPLVAALVESGYAGWVVVEAEQDPAHAAPAEHAKMGFDHLRQKWRW
ncbi:myo-inosose-2 dehydratase [Sphingomonas sp. TDK1]|uniref:myo-inosose-2 dehydratase n=1 Tax=Sphingomonas sp. TDK1 TaxID=453247 RepID=UPI0007D953D2|nr:myo-inosose-2 dehydratase [Sphingomonas sp. TDK1]OAN67072.1 myo-inosose-2 dehydratase [Sphingomonas sp. TDK1]